MLVDVSGKENRMSGKINSRIIQMHKGVITNTCIRIEQNSNEPTVFL